jgi:hypothetical protein
LPAATGAWAASPALKELFIYDGSGVMPGRTWIIAPDAESLNVRWSRLISEKDVIKKEMLFHPHGGGDKTVSKKSKDGLAGHEYRPQAVKDDRRSAVAPNRYAFRSFDRQWIIPDARLINRPNPALWRAHSSRQVFLTALERASPSSGPAVTFTGLIPDLDHYKGSFGGRVHPLWRERTATQSNIKPALLTHLATVYGQPVTAEDMMAYLAAVMAHPAFTARFAADLIRPGLRVPMTADASLFAEAVRLGSEVIWLHCYGERFSNPEANRPRQTPRLPKEAAPFIPAHGMIPSAPEPLPDTMEYDPATKRLKIGKGYVDNVMPEMWAYEISGKQVLWHWFSYRRRDRSRPIIGDRRPPSPLDSVQPESWLPEYTTDLLDLLHVLGRVIELEPAQADLLNRICASPLLGTDELHSAGAFTDAADKFVPTKGKSENKGASEIKSPGEGEDESKGTSKVKSKGEKERKSKKKDRSKRRRP